MSFDYTQENIEDFSKITICLKKRVVFEKFLKELFFALVEYNNNRKDISFNKNPQESHKIDFEYSIYNNSEYDKYVMDVIIEGDFSREMGMKLYDYFPSKNLMPSNIEYENTLWIGFELKSYIMNGSLPSTRYFSLANRAFIKKFIQNYNFGE